MDNGLQNQVESLLEQVRDLDPAHRDAELAKVEPALRAEVLSLLRYDPGDLPELPNLELNGKDPLLGRRIGPYKLLRRIGEGGMGAVYEAARDDDEFRKRVALKLIHPAFGGKQILQRFLNERQTLAVMDHPNIVKLLDGGTTEDGTPYLVMDYIEGVRIDEFCERGKLNVAERLKLFRTVCDAVHYAHQNLVVHRDLKPSNILVTANRVPKLLDFGIAKLLKPEAYGQSFGLTQSRDRPMTPDYASPEQIRGEPVTTGSDVYSLGVLLYRLLTHRSPYHGEMKTPAEIEIAVCQQDPERPSIAASRDESGNTSAVLEGDARKLAKRLNGDLDTILLMALRKEPQRRYASVERFSDDVRRHLEGLPVMARKDTWSYRTGKFVHRHRPGVIAAALVTSTLVSGIVTTTVEARRAERRFNDVRTLSDWVLFNLYPQVQSLPGATRVRKAMIEESLKYLDSLTPDAGNDKALKLELARGYRGLAVALNGRGQPGANDTAGSLASYQKALVLATAAVGAAPIGGYSPEVLAAAAQSGIGEILAVHGNLTGAIERYHASLAVLEPYWKKHENDLQACLALDAVYDRLADSLGGRGRVNQGDQAGALGYRRKAAESSERCLTLHPADEMLRQHVVAAHAKLVVSLDDTGDLPSAIFGYHQVLNEAEKLASDYPRNALSLATLAGTVLNLGNALINAGRAADALPLAQRFIALSRRDVDADPNDHHARLELALAHSFLGDTQRNMGELGQSIANIADGVRILEALSTQNPDDLDIRRQIAMLHTWTAEDLTLLGKNEESRRVRERALQTARQVGTRPGATPEEMAAYVAALVAAPPALRNPSQALDLALKAIDTTKHQAPWKLRSLANAHFQSGDRAKAIETLDKELGELPELVPGQPKSFERRLAENDLKTFRTGVKPE